MKIKSLIYLLLALSILMSIYSLSHAHESHGYKHLTTSSGPIIGQCDCPFGIKLWFKDHNSDGEVDACWKVILNHGVWHYKEIPTTITYGVGGIEPEVTCTCEEDDNTL
jgi:hypothetical protein